MRARLRSDRGGQARGVGVHAARGVAGAGCAEPAYARALCRCRCGRAARAVAFARHVGGRRTRDGSGDLARDAGRARGDARPALQPRALGLACGLLARLRPELALTCATLLVYALLRDRRAGLHAWLLALAGVAGLLAFRFTMFGHWLPLSWYAKAGSLANGVEYLEPRHRAFDFAAGHRTRGIRRPGWARFGSRDRRCAARARAVGRAFRRRLDAGLSLARAGAAAVRAARRLRRGSHVRSWHCAGAARRRLASAACDHRAGVELYVACVRSRDAHPRAAGERDDTVERAAARRRAGSACAQRRARRRRLHRLREWHRSRRSGRAHRLARRAHAGRPRRQAHRRGIPAGAQSRSDRAAHHYTGARGRGRAPLAFSGFPVEQRVAAFPFVQADYRVDGIVRCAPDYEYVVLVREPDR